ncbi:SDR family oxidoreductase [Paenibacillus sp. PL91]|uniref:SDR family oxidoreductase n=1 Tax=Paenibacillus sp. PL91 TaxID=2729538 RepID=UPI001CB97130|nr:SDR family oxidoreductase [Paenibacillus sp. PL91]
MTELLNLTGKVAFVTGATRGIGLETARGLGKLGAAVVIGSRDAQKGQATADQLRKEGLTAESVKCDVNSIEDHAAVYGFFEKNYGKLDILINNAGILLDEESVSVQIVNRTSTLPAETLRETFDVNFFAPIQLTQTLLPLIRKSEAGRIVNLSSVLGSLTLHADPTAPIYSFKTFAYNASKTALNAFTVHLAHELKDTPIKVNSIHPGWVVTALGGNKATIDVVEGSRTSIIAATLPADGQTGGFFHLDDQLPW